MSTACLIGRPTGPAGMKAVYCHWDGNPSTMVPVLRRLVLRTFEGRPAAAAHYLFRYSGFGYWASLTGSGDAYSSAMRADTANVGPVHRLTGEPWPTDVDVYHDHPDKRQSVLEYRDGRYIGDLVAWPQRWLYIIYPQVLAVARYVAPTPALGNDVPLGLNFGGLPWAEPVSRSRLLEIEHAAEAKVERILADGIPEPLAA